MNLRFIALVAFLLLGTLLMATLGPGASPPLQSKHFLANRLEGCTFAQVPPLHPVADNEEGHGYYRVKSYNKYHKPSILSVHTLTRAQLIAFANSDGKHKQSYQPSANIVDGSATGITDSNLVKVALDYVYVTYLCPETKRKKTPSDARYPKIDKTLSVPPLAAEIEMNFEILNYYSFSDLSDEQVRRMVTSFKVRLLSNNVVSLGTLETRKSDRHIIITSFQADPIDKCKLRLTQGLFKVDDKMCWDNDNSGDEGGSFGLFTNTERVILLETPVQSMGDGDREYTRNTCPSTVRRYVNQKIERAYGSLCHLVPEHEWLHNFPGHWMDFDVCTQKRRPRGTSILIFPTIEMQKTFRQNHAKLGTKKWILYIHGGSFYGYDNQNAGYNNVVAQISNYMKQGAGVLSIDYRTLMGDQMMYMASRQKKGTREYEEMKKLGLHEPNSSETFSWAPWVDSRSYTGFGYRSAMLDIARACTWLLDRKVSHTILCGDSSGATTVLVFYKFLFDELAKKRGERTTDKVVTKDTEFTTSKAAFDEHFMLAAGKGMTKFTSQVKTLNAKQAQSQTTIFDNPSRFRAYDDEFAKCPHPFGPTQKNNQENSKHFVHYGNLALNVCDFGVCDADQKAPARPLWTCNKDGEFTCDRQMPCVDFQNLQRSTAAPDKLFTRIDLAKVRKHIKGIILLSPWVDLACESPGYNTNAYNSENQRGDVFYPGSETLNRLQGKNTASFWLNKNFLDTRSYSMKKTSPLLFTDELLRTLPRIFAVTGSEEVLMEENTEFQKRVAKAGGRMRLEVYEHMWHGFSTTYVTGCGAGLINAHAQESLMRASEFADAVFNNRQVRPSGVYKIDPKFLGSPLKTDRSWEFAGVPYQDNNFKTVIRSCPLSTSCWEYFYTNDDSIESGRNTKSIQDLKSQSIRIPLSRTNEGVSTVCDESSEFWGETQGPPCEPKYFRSAWNFSGDQSGTITDWDSLLDFELFLTKDGVLNQWETS